MYIWVDKTQTEQYKITDLHHSRNTLFCQNADIWCDAVYIKLSAYRIVSLCRLGIRINFEMGIGILGT